MAKLKTSISQKKVVLNSLGLRSISPVDLIVQVNDGLAIGSWDYFIEFTGLPAEEVAEVAMVPTRTLSRRRKNGRFEPAESDRLMRLSMVVDKAVALFDGDIAGARQWLRTPASALGGLTPLRFAQTTVGAREVEQLIGRLEYGVHT